MEVRCKENCPCCETCKECVSFQKILHLKNAGLVIYRHSNRIDEVNKTTELLKSCKNTRDDIFIVHNTKDIQIKANDCISETDQGISCARCRELVQRAKKYLRNVPPIDKKDIISICDHCKQNIIKERSLNLCYKRHEILKKYHAEEIKHITAKEQIKTWLTISVNNFESVATDKNMKKSLKCRSLSELYLDKICNTAVKAGRHLEVRPMLQKGARLTESSHSIDNDTKSESALKFSHPEYIKSKSVLIRADSLLKIESYVSPSVTTYDMSLFVESPIKHEKYLRPTTAQIMKGILQKGTESTHKIKSKIGQSLSKLQNYYSDEEIFLSDASLKDHEIDKNFRYVFPKGISDKVAPLRRVKTSAELITDTQEMFRQRVMDEQKNFQAQRKILPTRKLRTGEKGTIASDDEDSSKKIKKKESEESAKIKKVKSGEKGEKTKKEKPEDDSEKNKESNVSKSVKERIQKDQKQKKESELRTTDKTDQIRKEKDEKLRLVEDKKKEQERLKKEKEQKQHEKQEQLRKEKELKQKLKEAQQKMKEEKEKNKKYDKAQAEPKQKTESISINIKNQQKYEHDKNKMEEDRNRKETKTEKANTDKEQIQKDQKQKKEFESRTKDKEKEEKHSEKKEQLRKEKELMQKLKEAEKNIKLDKAQAEPKGKPESINIKKQQNEEHDQNKKEEDRKRKEEAERKLKALEETKTEKTNGHEKPKVNKTQEEPTIKELQIKQIKMRMTSPDDLILQLVKLRQSIRSKEGERPKRLAEHHIIPPIKVNEHKNVHKNKKVKNYAMSLDSDLELDVENIATVEPTLEATDIIVGDKIFKCKHPLREKIQTEEMLPILYKSLYNEDTAIAQVKECTENFTNLKEHKPSLVTHKYGEQEVPKGIIRYALSDRSFIDKGWTMLPTEKVVRKMNVYRMRPAHPKFDWFERNKNKRLMLYDTGEKLAEFDDNGRGRWFYRNGRIALDYYDAEEMNAQQRFVIYGSGEPDERGRHQPIAILGTFDYLGNGVVFDHTGKIRLKYNQTEGVVLDRNIGPVSHWKWHTLNDPPVLQQVMIDTQMAHKDPEIVKLGGPGDDKVRPDNEEMLAIEFDNFIKEKSKKLSQKFKPFQIRTKALKINEKFSLKVLDQANIYLIFRDGTTNIKLNIGMILDHQEIVDTDTAEVGEVSNNLERFPARTDSLAGLQRSVAYAQRVERMRVEREHRLRHPEPCSSADKLTSAASRPLKPKLRAVASTSTVAKEDCICNCRKRSTCDVYYDTRFV